MLSVLELNAIEQLAPFRTDWDKLLQETPGATFFQSFEWLETYWKHFGADKKLRVILVLKDDQPVLFMPLIVRMQKTRVGALRVLTYPLDNWGSYYGPIGLAHDTALNEAMRYIHRVQRDWDMIELRWIGAPGADPWQLQNAMRSAGFQAYSTLWDRTAAVDSSGGWKEYLASRKGPWLRHLRQTEEKIKRHGSLSYMRCRPASRLQGDGDPHWDLYDACESIAQSSWQSQSPDGTTLSHESIRAFLRDLHALAASAGAVDINLLLFDGRPAAFIYGYHYQGNVYGLRRGFDAGMSREGLGTVLLWHTLEDSAIRGDRLYDMGIGSLESKRYFQNCLLPIYRLNHFPSFQPRLQLLRLSRWLSSRRLMDAP